MKVKKLLPAVVLVACSIVGCDTETAPNMSDVDRDFMVRASVSNTAEIGAGGIASTKATNALVKSFGQMMVAEHNMAQAELKALGNNVNFPVRDTLDPPHIALMAQLNALNGRAFDSVYIWSQVADHQAAINLFTMERDNGLNMHVKAYANKYLPNIQMHYVRADSIARALFRR